MSPYEGRCECVDCQDSAIVCNNDCELCQGCIEAAEERKDIQFEADFAWGRK